MSDRRRFIQGAVALGLVVAVPSLPLPADAYGEFLNAVRERIIRLAANGYAMKEIEIAPPHDGQRITYGEFMHRQREQRRTAFSKLSEEEKVVAWKARCNWLRSELPRLVQHGQRVESCPVCSHVELTAHRWPETFSCSCGAVIVLDRWLPDSKERVLIQFPVRSY